MSEYEKYQELQTKSQRMQEDYERQLQQMEEAREHALEELTEYYEKKLQGITNFFYRFGLLLPPVIGWTYSFLLKSGQVCSQSLWEWDKTLIFRICRIFEKIG